MQPGDYLEESLLCVTLLLGGDSMQNNMHVYVLSLYIPICLTEPC